MSMSVNLVLLVMVGWENVVIEVVLLHHQEVLRCHSSRCIDRCQNHVVECSEPNVDVSCGRCRKPCINEEVAR